MMTSEREVSMAQMPSLHDNDVESDLENTDSCEEIDGLEPEDLGSEDETSGAEGSELIRAANGPLPPYMYEPDEDDVANVGERPENRPDQLWRLEPRNLENW